MTCKVFDRETLILNYQGINTSMEQSYQDHPQFSMEGRQQDTVIAAGLWTNQDMISEVDQFQISREIRHTVTRALCKVHQMI